MSAHLQARSPLITFASLLFACTGLLTDGLSRIDFSDELLCVLTKAHIEGLTHTGHLTGNDFLERLVLAVHLAKPALLHRCQHVGLRYRVVGISVLAFGIHGRLALVALHIDIDRFLVLERVDSNCGWMLVFLQVHLL